MRGEFEPGWIAHRITIEQAAQSADGAGGSIASWSPLAAVWAAIEPVRAVGDTGSDRLGSAITHRVTIRHRTDVMAGMRIRHRGRLLAINTVTDPDERRRFLLIEAREETP
ncbi:MAG TPA: phage head closure protein [Kaistia sp.]|nr:phage head closure protein [Kaistia sp.]